MRSLGPNPPQRPSARLLLASRIGWLVPTLFPGALLHRAALWMAACGSRKCAARLFEAAALRYRRELRLEPLARLRVHQRMLSSSAAMPGEPERTLDIERGLLALTRIESPRPPFALVDARSLVGTWPRLIGEPHEPAARGTSAPARVRLAA